MLYTNDTVPSGGAEGMVRSNGNHDCSNGFMPKPQFNRAAELEDLLDDVKDLILPVLAKADSPDALSNGGSGRKSTLVDANSERPEDLQDLLNFHLPEVGTGKDGLMDLIRSLLKYSVNTWDRGFMHKLSGATNPVGVIAELLLAVLNANVHVYQVSPVLTSIEKKTARRLAGLFGLKGPYVGGVTQPGGSAANTTALVVARNLLFPYTKREGYDGRNFVIFTSSQSHYSVEKAAQITGLGSTNAWKVPADSHGRMRVDELERMVEEAQAKGLTPYFVNATAGTTVRGAYDPLPEIHRVCRRYNMWFHVDASWGGAVAFSSKHRWRLAGTELADSITINPHKMLGAPVTCSFLLTGDLRRFWAANTLPAGYLFHGNNTVAPDLEKTTHQNGVDSHSTNDSLVNGDGHLDQRNDFNGDDWLEEEQTEFWDLADLTLQCGRKGDALKLALGWRYYGVSGYAAQIDSAFEVAAYFANLIINNKDLILVGDNPPPCLQVCFYYAPSGILDEDNAVNTARTRAIADRLVSRGFMVDFAPGDRGSFFRPVMHLNVTKTTADALLRAVSDVGREVSGVNT